MMRRQRWGRIINIGAMGAERAFGQGTISAYAAAKAAVVAFSSSLAVEEAKHGITVNVVNPSNIDEREFTLEEARKIRDVRARRAPAFRRGRFRGREVLCERWDGLHHRPGAECERGMDAMTGK